MAHRIIDKPSGIMLSSNVGEVRIDVDGSYVDVQLIATGNVAILSERYYAYGGMVTLYDLASLMESNMRSSGESYSNFTLRVFTDSTSNKADSVTFNILYCDRFSVCTDVETFLRENFLTSLQYRRVADGSTTSLFYFSFNGESLAYSISYVARLADGHAVNGSFGLGSGTASGNEIRQLNISTTAIKSEVGGDFGADVDEIELLSFTVSCGQRSITCFVDRSLPGDADSFAFRNCFNVWDVAVLPHITTAKTDVDRSTAVVNGRSQFYNQSVEKKYEVTAGPLTADEAAWIDQLLTSYDVFRFEPNDCDPADPYILQSILITDMTCEISDSDDKPNTVKFTWRYTDNRPIVRFSASRGIFTSPFDYRYS
ncbi:MAG: hypothetical protein NC453_26250 [Muribaculum sp.]|nr:hypothetical protein [Muribaculum sp.]